MARTAATASSLLQQRSIPGDEDQAGSGEGVDLRRFEDRKWYPRRSPGDRRPVPGSGRGGSGSRWRGRSVRLVLAHEDGPHGPADVILLLGVISSNVFDTAFATLVSDVPGRRSRPPVIARRRPDFRRFLKGRAASPQRIARRRSAAAAATGSPSSVPSLCGSGSLPGRRPGSCPGDVHVLHPVVQVKSMSLFFALNAASTSELKPLPARASSPSRRRRPPPSSPPSGRLLLGQREEWIHPGPCPGGTIRIQPSFSSSVSTRSP